MVQARTFEQLVSVSKETVYGTGVAPTVTWPVTSAGGSLQMTETFDQGRRAVGSRDFDAVPDGQHGEFQVEGFAYPVFMGYLLLAMMGSETLTGAADPYTHTFKMATTPPSLTLEENVFASGSNNGIRYTGYRPSTLNFSFDAEKGALTYSCQGLSLAPSKVTTALTAPTSELRPWSGWTAAITSTNLTSRVASGEINIGRELQVVHTATATQTPRWVNCGPLYAEGQLLVSVEDLSDFDAVLADTRQSLEISFTQTGSPARTITFTMSNVVLNAAPLDWDRGGVSTFVRYHWRALHNTTDAGPLSVALINNRATTY